MSTQAWPYVVARGRITGYQAITGPGFLAEAGLTYLLEYASEGAAGEPDAATVREVIGSSATPLSVVYRVVVARAARYGLSGEDPLRDQAGRIIRVFEGLVLRLPADHVPALGLTVSDLDRVTDVSASAFRRLWTAPEAIEAEPTAALSAGSTDPRARRLNLRLAEPYVVPATRFESTKPRPTGPGPQRSRLIPVVVGVCVLALIVWFLVRLVLPSSQTAPYQAAVTQLCTDLKSGQDEAAYQEFSNHYRHSTTLAAFEHHLLGSATSATCTATSTQAAADTATLSLRQTDDEVKTVDLDMATKSGKWQVTAMKVQP